MHKFLISVMLILVFLSGVDAQQTAMQPSKQKKQPNKVYWGGELGLSFGSVFRISLVPMVGYKVTPKFHVGGKIGFAYLEDNRYDEKITSFNYGGSIFSRYLLFRGLYAHAEMVYWSYKYQTENFEGERNWVPFLLVGGGYIFPLSPGVALFVEALWDVLKDENSPYNSSDPFVRMGVGVGL